MDNRYLEERADPECTSVSRDVIESTAGVGVRSTSIDRRRNDDRRSDDSGIVTDGGVIVAQATLANRCRGADRRELSERRGYSSLTLAELRTCSGGPPTSGLMRLFEIITSASVLIVTAPLMLAIAIIIKVETPGPILFFQKRIGRNGKLFTFVKFRTLYADARERFPELYAYSYDEPELEGLQFKVVDDPRVTPQGKWLRTTSLDELPNFWNVLMGDMALVGPRPEIPEMLPYYKGIMLEKFLVRPGVTGYAQTCGRGHLGFYETVRYDLRHVREQSFIAGLHVIFKTIKMVLIRQGAF